MHRAMQPGQCPPVQSATIAAPRRPVGLAKLAFGLFLFGITIPFLLWIISERAAERGIMLSALMMLLSLVLGIFSFRETLGKITVVCSILTLLVYGAFIALMGRGPGLIQPQGEQVESQKTTITDTPDQAALRKKLDSIILPRIDFMDTSIEEAVDFLRLSSAELDHSETDLNKKGVSIIVSISLDIEHPLLYTMLQCYNIHLQ
jgi:Ca2+/Na+ antiporter